jgi:hypothetical protein
MNVVNIPVDVSPQLGLEEQSKPVVKKGRPTKKSLKEAKLPVGRPKGDEGRIAELKARLLATTGNKVINKIVEIAMTDGHPVQGAALKMCIDRVLPLSLFEKDAKGTRNAVTINITGIGEVSTQSVPAEIVDLEEEDES